MAEEVLINVKTNTKGVQDLNKEVEKTNKTFDKTAESAKKASNETDAMAGSVSALDKATGGLVTRISAFTKGVRGLSLGFKSLGVAIAASGIGLIVTAIAAVGAAFTRSEEGQNKFAKLMGTIGVVVNNVLDILSDFGEVIIAAFEEPQEAWESFVGALESGYQFVKRQVVDRFLAQLNILSGGFEAGVLKMRIAWNDFTGDAEEADQLRAELEEVNKSVLESVDTIRQANNEVVLLYSKATQAVGDFIAEQQREIEIAQGIADLRAAADVKERELIVARARSLSELNSLRAKAEDRERFSGEERIAFLQEAARIQVQLTNQEIELAEMRKQAIIEENKLADSGKEDKKAEAEAEARVFELLAQKDAMLRGLITREQAITREVQAGVAARIKARQDEIDSLEEMMGKNISIEQGYVEQKIEFDQQVGQSKQQLTQAEEKFNEESLAHLGATLNGVAQLLGEETAAGKTAAVAQATISTLLASQKAYTSTVEIPVVGPVLAPINAGLALAAGFKNIKEILKVKTPKLGRGGGATRPSAPGTGGSAASVPAPSFNVIGDTGTNQLNETINGRNQEPVKAWVSYQDIRTAGELENNAIESTRI